MNRTSLPTLLVALMVLLVTPFAAWSADGGAGREYHVSLTGDDGNDGDSSAMLKTISAAARKARPGDTITVHAGVYRERVSPPRGGESDAERITYQAAPGEKVEIKGSEVVKGWKKVEGDTWKVVLSNSFFGSFNPFADLIRGDWFFPLGREHHTGAVYLDGQWLAEAARLDDVLKPVGRHPLWFAKVDKEDTTIWAQFGGVDPNERLVEVNVRRTVFYPENPGIHYITVRGFTMRHAATPWAPPTAEQIGVIGVHWSKGWIIENNEVSHAACTGITLGKYGDKWDNTAASTAEGYVGTIERALKDGWTREAIGHHIVRNNHVHHCEQAGIVGSLGAAFSTVTGNSIHDIYARRLYDGAEIAGIKFHGGIDVQIADNHIYRCLRGIWLDWMTQGTRVSANLLHGNDDVDLFVEVNHGPFLVDNNIFLSPLTVASVSQGGAYVHNLIAGKVLYLPHDGRVTPFHRAHSTALAGMHDNPRGDDRYYHNIFGSEADLTPYDEAKLPVWMHGNVYLGQAKPAKAEANPLVRRGCDTSVELVEEADGWYLEIVLGKSWGTAQTRPMVTSELLGQAAIAKVPFDRPDGSPLRVDTDYFGERRSANPYPGPFELPEGGKRRLKVWPIERPQEPQRNPRKEPR